jgi:hypothetical protein
MSFFVTTQFKPKYEVTFHNGERNIGRLDFNSDAMVFEGDAEESAQVFFDLLAKYFADRLKQEREKEREACAQVVEDYAGHGDAESDARLIAAAPELLAALRDLLSGWMYIREIHGDLYGVGWDRAQEKALAAIAKSEGLK